MRLFIAINFSQEMKNSLKKIQDSLRKKGIRGNYTSVENLHLTLVFIGNYPDPNHIINVIKQINYEPLRLELDGYGNFKDLWWVGVKPSQELTRIVTDLRKLLTQEGIPYDDKKFTPHITLVRKTVFPEGLSLLSLKPASMIVDHISLMRSDRGKNHMIYTEIGRF